MRLLTCLLLTVLLDGCGSPSSPTAQDPTAQDPTATSPSPSPSVADREPLAVIGSNRASYDVATRLLLNVGVTNLGELEPAHGSLASIIGGRYGSSDVVVGVQPGRGPDVLVASSEVCGTPVETSEASGVQFDLAGHRWSVSAYAELFDDAGARPAVARDLAEALLCARNR